MGRLIGELFLEYKFLVDNLKNDELQILEIVKNDIIYTK